MSGLQTLELPEEVSVVAPDGSKIRLLPALASGGMCHCTLAPGEVSSAVRHRTVEEIWYVLAGRGRIWRRHAADEREDDLGPGVALTIPLGCHFQLRADAERALEVLICTMPPWPGADEAVRVTGRWSATVG